MTISVARPVAASTSATPARRSRRPYRVAGVRVDRVVAPFVTFGILGLLWQWVATTQTSVLPRLGTIFTSLGEKPGFYWENLMYTLTSAVIGFVIGVGVALILAVLIVHVDFLHAAIMPVAVLVHATPVLAIAPALVVAFGFGRLPHVIIVALITFFPMLINAITGMRAVPQEMLDVFRSMSASRMDIFINLRFPCSLGYLFAAAKTCATLAIIGAIVSEFTGATEGIGSVIITATTYLDLPQMWAAIFLSAGVSLVTLGAISLIEKAVIRWH